MSLHRLFGFRAAVADPAALDAYYTELGLTGDAGSGYTGSDGGAIVIVDEAPFRRLIAVDVGCDDERPGRGCAGQRACSRRVRHAAPSTAARPPRYRNSGSTSDPRSARRRHR